MLRQVDQSHRGWVAGLASASLFGSSAPLISSFSHGPSPVLVAGLLYAGAALVLLPLAVAEAPTSRHAPIQRQDLPLLGLITLLGGIGSPIALVKGLPLLTPSASALLLNLEAVFTELIAVGLGKEHLGREGWAAAALTFTGAVVLLPVLGHRQQPLPVPQPVQSPADLRRQGGHAIPHTSISVALLGIGSLGYGVSIWLDMVVLAALGAAREAVVFSTAPFLGALVAVALLGSPLTPSLLLASAAMPASTGLLLQSSHHHEHPHVSDVHHRHQHRSD